MARHFVTRHSLILAVVLAWPLAAGADRLYLKNGGHLDGRLVEEGERRLDRYVVETKHRGRIVVPRAEVERVDEHSLEEEKYLRQAHGLPDTVEAHWKLAQWCREHRLMDYYEQHLERIVELEPEHTEARRLLGYRSIGDRWLTRDELMAARGMVMHQGKYRSAQEIELLEGHESQRASAGEWRARLNRWRRQLNDRQPERVRAARDSLLKIRDPAAAEAVVDLLGDEDTYGVKQLLLKVLAQLEHQAAVDALIDRALFDPHEEIRAQSLEYLIKSGRPGLSVPFARGLGNGDNVIVNRAASALQEIGDPSAIGPLIDALVTEHRFVVGGPAGQSSYSMNSSGVSSFGSSGPRVEKRNFKNPSVLGALVALTNGQSFDYNQRRWRAWLAAQNDTEKIDLRRDR